MNECFWILAVLDSWLLIFLTIILVKGQVDLFFSLASWLGVVTLIAGLAFRLIRSDSSGSTGDPALTGEGTR